MAVSSFLQLNIEVRVSEETCSKTVSHAVHQLGWLFIVVLGMGKQGSEKCGGVPLAWSHNALLLEVTKAGFGER